MTGTDNNDLKIDISLASVVFCDAICDWSMC